MILIIGTSILNRVYKVIIIQSILYISFLSTIALLLQFTLDKNNIITNYNALRLVLRA